LLPERVDDLAHASALSRIIFTRHSSLVVAEGRRNVEVGGYVGERYLHFQFQIEVGLARCSVEALGAEVSVWARKELASVIECCCRERNPQLLLVGLQSYCEFALKRARIFGRLGRRFPELLGGYGRVEGKLARREVGAYLGESVLRFRRRKGRGRGETGEVEFVLCWKLGIDDTGEVESQVEGDARVPRSCECSFPLHRLRRC
jgi:hypothetical protein